MNNIHQLDRTYHYIMKRFVESGTAPTVSEIAGEFNVAPERGRQYLHELIKTGGAMWLEEGTDRIASFAPFHNSPTPYRITVEGRQKWFGQ